MANCRCRSPRQEAPAVSAAAAENTAARAALEPMEEDVPMNRYINPRSLSCGECSCSGRDREDSRSMMEQLVELAAERNQLLVDLLGAVNALTAAILSRS